MTGPPPGGLRGRTTLYGEYLMHRHAAGYVFPAPYWLAAGAAGRPAHPAYARRLDMTATLVGGVGLRPLDAVSGTLPLGLGFAGSTVLTLLHVGDQLPPDRAMVLARYVDRIVHRFAPSGVDLCSVRRQRPGFFRAGGWRDAPELRFEHGYWLPPPGPPRPLPQVRAAVHAAGSALARCADRQTRYIDAHGRLDRDELFAYAELLAGCDVYAPAQRRLIERALANGVIAKGIGGLYNKAVLLIGPEPARSRVVAESVGSA